MKKASITFLLLTVICIVKSQTLVPYLLKNGKYRYIDSSTKIISSITGEISGRPELFSKNGHVIYQDAKTGKTRIINKNGQELFNTEETTKDQYGIPREIKYNPFIIYDASTNEEIIIAVTVDYSKQLANERYRGFRIFENGVFSKYIKTNNGGFHGYNDFSEGLTTGTDNNSSIKEGYVNKTGDFITPLIFEKTSLFSEGRGAVYSQSYNAWGFVDKRGEIVIPMKYSSVHGFDNGLALVTLKNNNEQFFIDTNGNKIMEFIKGDCGNEWFSDSLIGYNLKYNSTINNFYNNKGKLKVTVNYKLSFINSEINNGIMFDNGTLLIENKKQEIGLVDKKNKLIVQFGKYKKISKFNEGLAAVQDSKGYWGFINNKGIEVIRTQYYDCRSFSDGLSAVKKINGWGFINTKGDIIIDKINFNLSNGKYNGFGNFKNGFNSLCNNNGECIYFDKAGYYYIEQ